MAGMFRCIDIFCVWDCCWLWLQFQKYVSLLVFDPFVELFITLCIVVNTLFMALDHHDMDKDMERVLKSGNYVSTANMYYYRKIMYARPMYYANLIIYDYIDDPIEILVLHGDVRYRSVSETDSDEPKILFSRGLEYFRFYHRRSLAFGVGSRRRARSVGITILQIGEWPLLHCTIILFIILFMSNYFNNNREYDFF